MSPRDFPGIVSPLMLGRRRRAKGGKAGKKKHLHLIVVLPMLGSSPGALGRAAMNRKAR
jgi:hypothetical protein